jgi:hypothetical protein
VVLAAVRKTCFAVALLLPALSASLVSAQGEGCPPRAYQLGLSSVPGWSGKAILVSRRENNWWAWHDSRPVARFFYTGGWNYLGRADGWFEQITLQRRSAQAQATILVSQFASTAAADRAYNTVADSFLGETHPLRLGTKAEWFMGSTGIASGPGGGMRFGTYDVYLESGDAVAEITTRVWMSSGMNLPNAARAVGRALAAIPSRPGQCVMVSTKAAAMP